DRPGALDLAHPRGNIEFKGVWFRYPAASDVAIESLEPDGIAPLGQEASDWILRDVNLTAPSGSVTALVGPSGAGKTTLCNLLPRLYDVSLGTIELDGRDLRDISLD